MPTPLYEKQLKLLPLGIFSRDYSNKILSKSLVFIITINCTVMIFNWQINYLSLRLHIDRCGPCMSVHMLQIK